MEVRIPCFDCREKRWYAKVVRAAERTVNDRLAAVEGVGRVEVHAHFDTSEGRRVRIVEHREGRATYTVLVFAAQEWQTVAGAIPSAVVQLASAIPFLTPVELRPQLGSLLAPDEVQLPVKRSSSVAPDDGLIDFYLYIEEPLAADAFFALIDRIDGALTRQGIGEVSGNAYSLLATGSCIDLVGANRHLVQAVAAEEIRASGIGRYRFEP